jgi:prepilin-type N-terminal cleavage/methylation domain-containing protein
MTLFEKLVVIAIIGILASILLTTVSKSYINAKAWIWGAYAMQENRIEAALSEDEKRMEVLFNRKVDKWTFVP